jgi:hypothetical protein
MLWTFKTLSSRFLFEDHVHPSLPVRKGRHMVVIPLFHLSLSFFQTLQVTHDTQWKSKFFNQTSLLEASHCPVISCPTWCDQDAPALTPFHPHSEPGPRYKHRPHRGLADPLPRTPLASPTLPKFDPMTRNSSRGDTNSLFSPAAAEALRGCRPPLSSESPAAWYQLCAGLHVLHLPCTRHHALFH